VLTDKPMHRIDAYRMIRRRTAEAGVMARLGCHVFRATGMIAYLEAGGTLENVQAMAAHESPLTTKLYNRTGNEITLDEIERITLRTQSHHSYCVCGVCRDSRLGGTLRTRQQPRRVQNERHLGCDVNESGKKRV
jgi:hypothetical protein